MSSSQDSHWDEEIVKILRRVGSLRVEYPSEFFTARRAAFVLQVHQDRNAIERELSLAGQFNQYFEILKFARADYPSELLSARRAAFVDLLREYSSTDVTEDVLQDREITQLFQSLKSTETEYPAALLAARRATFRRQVTMGGRTSILEALRTSIQSLLQDKFKTLSVPPLPRMRVSLAVIVLMLAVFVVSLLRTPVLLSPASPEASQPGSLPAATEEVAQVICKPGYVPPLCLAKEFDKSDDLTFPGNGIARPAVAKDTLPGYSGVHKPAYVNDGLYGPGASWISNSAYSWIKIDLGTATTINTVAFGRDRLGKFNDRDPGQFVIAVALSDNVYADGNSSNDYVEYTEVYDSEQIGFDGVVSGPETIKAQFGPVMARYIKIVFANPGTAVDEVEVFMAQPDRQADYATRIPKEDSSDSSGPSVPMNTPRPTKTATPFPTSTPLPTKTATPLPTDTPVPTDTAVPTDTPVPTDTDVPVPTDTSLPPPTPIPLWPTDTPMPLSDETVPMMIPTDTFVPGDSF